MGTIDFFFFMDLAARGSLSSRVVRAGRRKRVCTYVYVCMHRRVERHASARVRSTIVIKGDANWWQSEVRPKARARRPGTLRVFVPFSVSLSLSLFLLFSDTCGPLCLAEVPEILDTSRMRDSARPLLTSAIDAITSIMMQERTHVSV